MIYFMGDIHGEFFALEAAVSKYKLTSNDILIQVGDFGVFSLMLNTWDHHHASIPCPVYFIDGNHEDYNIIGMWARDSVTEVAENLFYVPRGLVLILQNKRIGFLGGAESIDVAWRRPGKSWFPEESVTQQDVEYLVKNVGEESLDVLVTHAPPSNIIKMHFLPLDLKEWQLALTWVDQSAILVQEAVMRTNPNQVVSGHMHRSVVHENKRILNIDEVWALED